MSEIGSDFALIGDVRASGSPIPWELAREGVYMETGRQALRAVAREAASRGISEAFLPGYLCESMITPFLAEGLEIHFLPMDDHLWLKSDAVDLITTGTLLLHAPYFGRENIPIELLRSLHSAASLGVIVVEDATHCALNPHHDSTSYASYEVASLRKLLPIPDGAWVSGLTAPQMAVRNGPAEERARAMRRKAANLEQGNGHQDHIGALRLSEQRLTETQKPYMASKYSLGLLRSMDYEKIAQRRRRNGEYLARELEAFGVCHYFDAAGVPSHLVIRTEVRDQLREFLRKERIYCPIHWPRPVDVRGEWRGDLLSLPVDQRYGINDMQTIAKSISKGLATI